MCLNTHPTPMPTASSSACSSTPAAPRRAVIARRSRLLGRVCWIGSFTVLATVVGGAVASAEAVAVLAQPGSLDQVLTNIRNYLMGILTVLATLCVTIAAIRYGTANGNVAEIDKAKLALRSAGFGYGLAVLAPLLVSILKQIFGA
ncbi:pilin [Allokutzneria sp. A3M-2-11 16]|uniref:pilin n=1 Tax=Allokutzneria sp. A3M-2-11 16 TaxID=2962043 RepID=UPI0020B89A99|nr:pilin [Allokutzneria sp. A3M-2-11 16]MCP3800727.1 pilin [Allokutzneria sp. A3M-2-11 16]